MNKVMEIVFKLGFLCVWLGIGYFVLNFPRTQELEKEYPVVVYSMENSSLFEKTSVKVTGTLTKRLFSEDRFSGKIEYYDFEADKVREYDMWFIRNFGEKLVAGQIEKANPHVNGQFQFPDIVGGVYLTKDLKEITIWLDNKTQPIMSGPATTCEEAIKLDNKIWGIK